MENNSENKKQKPKKSKLKKIFWYSLIVVVLFGITAGFFLFQYVVEGLPSLEELENPKPKLASNVYSADGELIGQFFRQNRIETDIDSIPSFFIDGLVATEDRKFFEHWGVDLERFAKAMVKNVLFFDREGASTITQQLAKNLYNLKVRDENIFQTIVRKMREWITAVQIEKTYTKREILQMYLNISYFGHGAYGVETAASVYFGKKVKDLTIPEAAVLVALLKSSVIYDPVDNYNNSIQRRNLVMYNMRDVGFITQKEYQQLREEPIELNYDNINKKFRSDLAPHFTEHVRRKLTGLADKYDINIYEDGLTIYTTLDSRLQKIANAKSEEHVQEFQKMFNDKWSWKKEENREILNDMLDKAIRNSKKYKNAASEEERLEVYNRLKNNVAFVDSVQKEGQKIEVGFVVLDAKTGHIKAMIGGRDESSGLGLNHTTQIKRQPGSAFKPLIYTVAIDEGLYPAYPILNQPFDYDGWQPNNFEEGNTGGFLTLREALRNSVNLVSARLVIEGHVPLWKVGIVAEKMGIKTKQNLVPAISLGTADVSPLELTAAYATLANKGIYNEPIAITKIENKDGIIVDTFFPQTREALDESTAYIINDMLQSVVNSGTAMRVRTIHNFRRPAAGKTGTTQDYGDAWFVGFTPQLAAGVWVGFDDRRVTFTGSYGQGAKAAIPIWANFMKEAYEELNLPIEDFEMPENGNVVTVDFCEHTIYELGDPKLWSKDCESGKVTDIIKLNDVPPAYNSERDTTMRIFDKYMVPDSTSHEAIEIIE